jgi:hypothetical protein
MNKENQMVLFLNYEKNKYILLYSFLHYGTKEKKSNVFFLKLCNEQKNFNVFIP